MSAFRELAYDDFDEHDIALTAYSEGLAEDYEKVPGETAYRLIHPNNSELSLVFSLEYNDDDNVIGWTYTQYELDDDVLEPIDTNGDGLDDDEPVTELLDAIERTLTDWAY